MGVKAMIYTALSAIEEATRGRFECFASTMAHQLMQEDFKRALRS